jgi:hypothetical protein
MTWWVLLKCVDAIEARKIIEEVHEGLFGTHANVMQWLGKF